MATLEPQSRRKSSIAGALDNGVLAGNNANSLTKYQKQKNVIGRI